MPFGIPGLVKVRPVEITYLLNWKRLGDKHCWAQAYNNFFHLSYYQEGLFSFVYEFRTFWVTNLSLYLHSLNDTPNSLRRLS